MTITPDQARALLDGATPGPWDVHTDPDDPDGTFIYDDTGNMCIAVEPAGSDYREADLALAAAAPDLAQTIAGMRWEWAVEVQEGSKWFNVYSWRESLDDAEWDLMKHKGWSPDSTFRFVRRLVGPVEEAE